MISQLYPGHQDDEHERALDRTLDGRFAAVWAERRREIDRYPLACWIDEREDPDFPSRG